VSGSVRGLLLALIASLALASAAVAVGARAGTALRIESALGGDDLRLPADGTFTYRYRQSVYETMVEEELRVEAGGIRVVRARSEDRRALEYFRWPGEPYQDGHTLAQDAPALTSPALEIRVSPGAQQTITADGRTLRLEDTFGATSVVVRPTRVSPLTALLQR
jgi:hypothetical protein